MPKFSNYQNHPARPVSPNTRTHEGAPGYLRSPRSELFIQAVSEMAEDTYYESATHRQARIAENVRKVIAEPDGWQWITRLVGWLRDEANMRSASIMIAAEAIAAKPNDAVLIGPSARQLVSFACVRADEPAEFLGYWLQNHGRNLPAPVKRGIADSAARLYTERNALKYDGQSRAIRMADVIELTHPKPRNTEQSLLFRYLLDSRHGHATLDRHEIQIGLPLIHKDQFLLSLSEDERLVAFRMGQTTEAGWSWERVAGWLPGGLTAQAWETLIPTMGYMALLRNLRNFEQAGISEATKKFVCEKLADSEQVARSRQFPYRFLSAWKASQSLDWAYALETATNLSVQNVPEFSGRTLILVDTSGSMQSPVGGARSQAMRYEVAALFGAALAFRNVGSVDLAIYATSSKPLVVSNGASILRACEDMRHRLGEVGHGTNTWDAIRQHYQGHDRVIVLTDEQSHDYGQNPGCFMHFINLAGYRAATAPKDRRTFAYGGFTDAMFSLLPIMEQGTSERWPWQ